MIYKFMLAKLRELARPKVLNYKYDDKMSLLTIDICEDYYFCCYVNKDMVINLDLCKFIIAKICNSFYNYLILHRWLIPSKLERRFKSMMIYMKRYKHSKNIKFKGAMLFHKIKPVGMIDNVFNLIACSSFPEIWLQISYSDISNCIGTTFSKIMKLYSSSVQKIIIAVINNSDYIECENPSSNNLIKVMLAEYGVNYHTYVLYKFLENSRLLDSIKKIEFIDSLGIDYTILESLIVKYQRKNNIECGISFILKAHAASYLESCYKTNWYFYSLVSILF